MSQAEEKRQAFHISLSKQIAEQLRNGTSPWLVSHDNDGKNLPYNPINGKSYSAVNNLVLSSKGYADNRWLTFDQANEQGYQVKKGEKATQIVFYSFYDYKTKEKLVRPKVTTVKLFNAEQLNGIEKMPERELSQEDLLEKVQSIFENSQVKIVNNQKDKVFYRSKEDTIYMPPKETYKDELAYSSAALHEMCRWAGHDERMNFGKAPFGTEAFAREKLRTELATYFITKELGLDYEPQGQAFAEQWADIIEKNPYEILNAARDAEKIKGYILQFDKTLEKAQELEQANIPNQQEQTEQKEKVFLSVEWHDKEDAKKFGAKWDKDNKSWYVLEGTDLAPFEKWLPDEKKQEVAKDIYDRLKNPEEFIRDMKQYMNIPFEELDKNQEQEKKQEPNIAEKKTFLAVPYKEKDEVKALGAKWDSSNQNWYVPEGTDLTPFDKWAIQDIAIRPEKQAQNFEAYFIEQLKEIGLVVDELILDGDIHRVPVVGKENGKDGAYAGFSDDKPYCWGQNFVTNERKSVFAPSHKLTDEERTIQKAEQAEKQQKRESKRQQGYDKSADIASQHYYSSMEASPDHAYLKEKGIQAFNAKQNVYGDLVIPMYNIEGQTRGVQFIAEDGTKRFHKGIKKKGSFGFLNTGNKDFEKVLVCEGFATGASLHEATKLPVAIAFDAGNMENVAKAFSQKHQSQIIICADNDHHRKVNVGLETAKKVALAVNGKLAYPTFSEKEKEQKLTDFNDLHKSQGLEAVKREINFAKAVSMEQDKQQKL